jgi:DNA-binding CsgD family transcriptional regulator
LGSERALRLTSDIGWRAGEAYSRYLLADCLAWRGDFERALGRARESLAIAEELGHLEWQCGARRVLGTIALDLHALPESLAHLEAAHDIALELASATWLRWTAAPYAIALARSGCVDRASDVLDRLDGLGGEPSAAAPPSGEGLRTLGACAVALARAEVAVEAGAPPDALSTLAWLDRRRAGRTPKALLLRAQASSALERWDDACAWLRAARTEAHAQEARPLLWHICAADGAVKLAQRQRLEARRSFDEARARAAELVVELNEPTLVPAFRAHVDTVAPPPPARTSRQVAKAVHGGLTRRERDAASLVARGNSNRAIARTLGIGERTVEGYVAAAFSKLGFSSRSQLAVWAVGQGLASRESAPAKTRP